MLTVDYDRLGLTAGELVLDLGCGAGRHTFESLRRSTHTISVDVDDVVLKDTSGMAAAMTQEGEIDPDLTAACVRADALQLPFVDRSFDTVIASEVLEHIRRDDRALGEIARVLKPGGRVAVTVPRFWPELLCWALSREYHATAGGHLRIYRRSELVDKLRRAGFFVTDRHHAHAFHSPYWWAKCVLGERAPVRAYHRLLVWQITSGARIVGILERSLDPLLGKSLVVYAVKRRGKGGTGGRGATIGAPWRRGSPNKGAGDGRA
ncbi:MAG: class I SAM-dependent methyltransferase [Actinomycetota bacterium]